MTTHDPAPTADDWFPRHPLLRPDLRVVRRDDGHQVGRWPGERLLLPDSPGVRAFLDDLVDGRRPDLSTPASRRWARLLLERGLLVDDGARARRDARRSTVVSVADGGTWGQEAEEMLRGAGVRIAHSRLEPDVVLVLRPSGELARRTTDPWLRSGTAHLPVTQVAGRTTVGPFVAPGLTACLRCVDAHDSDVDPGHGMVVEQHACAVALPTDPVLFRLALAWAVRDVVAYAEGGAPSTWSAAVRLDGRLTPERTAYLRHPRCGCSWGDALASA